MTPPGPRERALRLDGDPLTGGAGADTLLEQVACGCVAAAGAPTVTAAATSREDRGARR